MKLNEKSSSNINNNSEAKSDGLQNVSASSTEINQNANSNSNFVDDGASALMSIASSKLYGKSNVSGEDIENFVLAMTLMQQQNTSQTESSSQVKNNESNHDHTSSSSKKTVKNNINNKDKKLINNNKKFTKNKTNLSSELSNSSNSKQSYDDSDDSMTNDSKENEYSNSSSGGSSSEETDEEFKLSRSNTTINNNNVRTNEEIKKTKANRQNNKQNNPKLNKLKQSNKQNKPPKQPKQRKQRNSSSTNNFNLNENSSTPTAAGGKKAPKKEPERCYGPECVNQALANSKYCSFECGMKLAKSRIAYFLKASYDNYNQIPPLANSLNLSELNRINNEINVLKNKLTDLEEKHLELDKLIERAKHYTINPNIEKDRDKNSDSNESEIYCVTCGIIINEKHALKHMEKCYNKIESQAFFGSFYKTQTDGSNGGNSMFCDYYNAPTKMYCKRLKVMCPEHEKERKVNDNEVCGYPLPKANNILDDSENDICLASKRNCSIHLKWEKLRRAQIDLEKLRTVSSVLNSSMYFIY